MTFSINSRSLFPTAWQVSGYDNWSTFMNLNAISFYVEIDGLQNRSDSASTTVELPEAGSYTVLCSADNPPPKAPSSLTVAENSCNIGGISSASSTTIEIPSPGSYTVSLTIANEPTPAEILQFGDNPMGMAFTITKDPEEPEEPEPPPVYDGGTIFVPSTVVCPSPTPWVPDLPPDNCGSPPFGSTSPGGLQLSVNESSPNSIRLTPYGFQDKLVTIQFSHTVESSWTNGFSFNIPEASDIIVNDSDIGGLPYSRQAYTNPSMPGSTGIVIANLDGGENDFIFNHSSQTPDPPTRTIYNKTCSNSSPEEVITTNPDGSTTVTTYIYEICTCPSQTQTYGGPWPGCNVGVWIIRSSGDEVEWIYSDGRTSDFEGQRVIATVVDSRPIVPLTGPVNLAVANQSLYINEMEGPQFSVNSYRNYVNESLENRLRFRNPVLRESKSEIVTSATDPSYDDDDFAAFSEFRSYAGAQKP